MSEQPPDVQTARGRPVQAASRSPAAARGVQVRRLGVLVLVAAGLAVLGTPQITRPRDRYHVGEFTTQAIRAPYDVSVVDEEATKQQRARVAEASPVVCRLDPRAAEALEGRFARALAPLDALLPPAASETSAAMPPRAGAQKNRTDERARRAEAEARQLVEDAFSEAERLLGTDVPGEVRARLEDRADLARLVEAFGTIVTEAYRAPLVDDVAAFRRRFANGAGPGGAVRVVLVDRVTGHESPPAGVDRLSDVPAAREALRTRATAPLADLPGATTGWLASIVGRWLVPNVTADEAATRDRRLAASDAILPVSIAFRRNELIVGEGQPVTRQALLVLDALRRQRLDRDTWRR